ncbi:MAG: zinc-binding dehydrogenase [Rhodoferax sp.]|nr:zinc-binding dehydrogenase [Rhodoferax sp.]
MSTTAKIIDGNALAASTRAEVAVRTAALSARGLTPGLAVVLVGENPASQVYVRNKVKACADAGLHSVLERYPASMTEAELLARIDALNQDPSIHGILVQLPLPAHMDANKVIEAISPAKDVDGFHVSSAGALMVGHLTAWRMLFGKRALQAGETVLVVGIGGGVAVACLQLAKLAGARVLVTSGSDDKLARALAQGADGGVNYRTEKVAQRVLQMTGGEGVDMVIDSVGQASWADSLKSLRRGGRLVTCGATTGSNPGADLQRMFIRQLEVYGSTGGSIEEFRQLVALFARGA